MNKATQSNNTTQAPGFLELLRNQNTKCEDFAQLAHQAYQELLEKPGALSNHNIKHLIIIPDGQLSLLPFEGLATKPTALNTCNYQNISYLLKEYPISYAYSATTLLQSMEAHEKATKSPNFLGIAPRFNTKTNYSGCGFDSLYLNNLAYGIAEIEEILPMLEGKNLKSDAATTHNFRTEYEGYEILHFSTHACQQGEDTRIFLANGESLTGKELRNLSIDARLTVLSACETGLGEMKPGEGVMSLARDLSTAGTQSVIMSLWAVPDGSTKKIMVEFYKQLKKGKSKAEALRQAKLFFIRDQDFAPQPYQWAALALVGNTEAIYSLRSWFWLLFLLPLAGLGWYFYDLRRKERPVNLEVKEG